MIVEVKYLLLTAHPWAALRALFDTIAAALMPEAVLRRRLTARWIGYGLPPEAVAAEVEGDDLPHGRAVMADSVPAGFVIDH